MFVLFKQHLDLSSLSVLRKCMFISLVSSTFFHYFVTVFDSPINFFLQHEQKRGHCISTLDSYMKEHNTTKDAAVAKVRFMIEDAWKTINQAFLKPNDVPMPLIERVANFCRMMEAIHKYLDTFTHSASLKEFIFQLFAQPIAIWLHACHSRKWLVSLWQSNK